MKILTLITITFLGLFFSGCLEDNDLGEPPSATLSASPTQGTAPLTVDFSFSVDNSGYTIKKIEWDFDGDGIYEESTTISANGYGASHIYTSAGSYDPGVKVIFNENEASSYDWLDFQNINVQ